MCVVCLVSACSCFWARARVGLRPFWWLSGVGGVVLQFGSAVFRINDRDSDLDLLVVVSEDVSEGDFFQPSHGPAGEGAQ
jgi:hypothetical protein